MPIPPYLAHFGFVFWFVQQENDPHLPCLLIVFLVEPVCSHVPVQDVNIHIGLYLLKLQGVLDSLVATHPAAVWSLTVTGTGTLDHHQVSAVNDIRIPLGYLVLKLKLGEHPWVSSIEVFLRFVLFSPGGDNSHTMLYLLYYSTPVSHYLGSKVAHIPIGIYNPGIGIDSNSGMFGDALSKIGNKSPDISFVNGVMYPVCHSAKLSASLDKMDLKSLVR